jgi:uncharacterized protein (TIGR00288 family)
MGDRCGEKRQWQAASHLAKGRGLPHSATGAQTMENDRPATQAVNRRIALLIDADNVSHSKIALMLAELSKYGTANIRRAYGDWGSTSLKGWKDKLHDFAIRPIQQFSYSTGKNATDIALVIDAMELLYTQDLDAFCIASSDADFTPLIMQLKANGHDVYGFGARKTPSPFVIACTTFLYLESLDDPANVEPESAPSEPARRRSSGISIASCRPSAASPPRRNRWPARSPGIGRPTTEAWATTSRSSPITTCCPSVRSWRRSSPRPCRRPRRSWCRRLTA